MKQPEFTIRRFNNRNGAISWRMIGYIHGERIRRNFKTREEAAAEKAALETKRLQIANGHRALLSSLTDEQAREAEAAFLRLRGKAHSLSFYLDFALANYQEPEQRRKSTAAIADYVAAKESEFAQDQISQPHMERIRSETKRFVKHFGDVSLDEITPPRVVSYLESTCRGLKTWNNRRGVVSNFFRFAFYRGWIAENPLARIPQHRVRRKRGMATTLSLKQARELMSFLEGYQGGKFVPYYALCLFAGIRPGVPNGEIKKLKPEAVNLETGIIHISAEVSKTREPRRITIQPNLAAWLRAYRRRRRDATWTQRGPEDGVCGRRQRQVYAHQIQEAIARDGFYVRVPAGHQFYLYVTETIDQANGSRGNKKNEQVWRTQNEK